MITLKITKMTKDGHESCVEMVYESQIKAFEVLSAMWDGLLEAGESDVELSVRIEK